MKNLLSIVMVGLTAGNLASADPSVKGATLRAGVEPKLLLEIHGRIYPKDAFPAECKELLAGAACPAPAFGKVRMVSRLNPDGLVHATNVFTAPEGDQVIEESWEKEGRVQRAVIENRVLQKRSELEVRDGKVHYKVTDLRDHSVKTSVDDSVENLVVPSTVMSYIRPHFDELEKGKEFPLKVAVLDRRDSFSFVMRKLKSGKTVSGEDFVVLEMAPVSLIVKAVVDPMRFYLKPATGELFAFEGKSALKRKKGDSYEDLKVQTVYDYKVNSYRKAVAVKKDCSEPEWSLKGAPKCEVKAQ
jgi:hypothetical protein